MLPTEGVFELMRHDPIGRVGWHCDCAKCVTFDAFSAAKNVALCVSTLRRLCIYPNNAANLDLSKRRAAAVKAELAKSFGVNADQLETDGMGEKQPVVPNNTPVNKAQNRRVEFIKL